MVEDIRLYDFEFNLLHIENDIVSSNWTLKYNGIGTWEGHFNINSDILPIAIETPYLVAVQGNKQAIVTSKQLVDEGVLYGRTVNWILSRRAIQSFKTSELSLESNDIASIAKWIIDGTFDDVDNFIVSGDADFTEQRQFWRNTTNPVNEVISDLLKLENAGHEVFFDVVNKQWVFRIKKSKNLQLTISESFRNASDTEYSENLLDYYTSGWYEKREDEETEGVWVYLQGEKTGIYKWDAVLGGSVESEAVSSLKNKKWTKEIKTNVQRLDYGTHYNLGDIVRVQKLFGGNYLTFEKIVAGVDLWYENNDTGEKPILEDLNT